MKRNEVYRVIDSERDYQDKRWGGDQHDLYHTVGDWLIYMEHYINKAKSEYSTASNNGSALDNIRKATALGVACMENFDTQKRE